MPRQAYVYIAVILIFAALGVPLTATHLKHKKAAANALKTVKEANQENAATLETQRKNLDTARAELTQANLGWDEVWDDVDVRIDQQRGQLTLNIGTNNGVSWDVTQKILPVLHGFTTIGNELKYVGPFQAVSPPRTDTVTVKPMWTLFPYVSGLDPNQWQSEARDWRGGKWKFRSLIPAGDKRRFEGLAARAQSAVTRFRELQGSVAKQGELQTLAEEQAERRREELLGANDPNVEEDPLQPQLKYGLNKALQDEEESRNAVFLEVDALRRAILEEKRIRIEHQAKLKAAEATTATPSVPRIGDRRK